MFQWMKIQSVYESLGGVSVFLKISENEEIWNEEWNEEIKSGWGRLKSFEYLT